MQAAAATAHNAQRHPDTHARNTAVLAPAARAHQPHAQPQRGRAGNDARSQVLQHRDLQSFSADALQHTHTPSSQQARHRPTAQAHTAASTAPPAVWTNSARVRITHARMHINMRAQTRGARHACSALQQSNGGAPGVQVSRQHKHTGASSRAGRRARGAMWFIASSFQQLTRTAPTHWRALRQTQQCSGNTPCARPRTRPCSGRRRGTMIRDPAGSSSRPTPTPTLSASRQAGGGGGAKHQLGPNSRHGSAAGPGGMAAYRHRPPCLLHSGPTKTALQQTWAPREQPPLRLLLVPHACGCSCCCGKPGATSMPPLRSASSCRAADWRKGFSARRCCRLSWPAAAQTAAPEASLGCCPEERAAPPC